MKTINFDNLKNRIKNNVSVGDLMLLHPGDYLFDRMCQHADKQEKFGSLHNYDNANKFKKMLSEHIDRVDIRSYKELLDLAKRIGITIPKWLYGSC